MQSKTCLTCGKTFFKTTTTSQAYWNNKRVYCSNRCKVLGKVSLKKGKQYPNIWRNDVTYGALHLQVHKKYGKPKKCIQCGSNKDVEWANKSNNYRNVDDFIELCSSCHKKYDIKMNKRVVWNKGVRGEEFKKHFVNGMGGQFPKGKIPWNKKPIIEK